MPLPARVAAGIAIADALLHLPELHDSTTAAAYLSFGSEPPTADLLHRLGARGVRVLTPVLQPDLDLDWEPYDVTLELAAAESGLPKRGGERLGVEAVRSADVVIVPALAVDVHGRRLGRGGGSYDRALARLDAATPVITLLYDGEVLPEIPVEAHDRAVAIAVSPSRVWRF